MSNMEFLIVEGYFSKFDNDFTQEEYTKFYNSIDLSKNIKVGSVNVIGYSKPQNVYLSDICNIIETDNIDYGNCVFGELYIKLPQKKIDKLSENNFEGIDLPDCYKVVINGEEMFFFPTMWLY